MPNRHSLRSRHTHSTWSLDTLWQRVGPVDRILLLLVLLISSFGLVMVYNTSISASVRLYGHPYQFILDQATWFGIGIVVLLITSRVSYKIWYKLCVPLLFVTIGLLLLVFIPGIGVKALGASRWINLGFITIQPSEVTKLAIVIYLSAWLSTKERQRLGTFLLFLCIILGLVLLQPDMGTSIILFCIAISLYIISGSSIKELGILLPLIVGAFTILAIAAPYRLQRLTSFLNPEADPLGSSYQIRQAILGIGSGGVFGVGFGQSKQKFEYLPEANTDAVFAVVGEELGLVGSSIVVLLFLLLVYRGFQISRRTSDRFGAYIAAGITAWVAFQSAINMGAIVSLLPLTGVPLPFISYGGSSLLVLLAAYGIVLNISRTARKE